MKPNAIIIENIDDFLKDYGYYVKSFEIHEALSEPTKYILELVIKDGNLWNINIPLHHGVKVTLNYWIEDLKKKQKENNNKNSSYILKWSRTLHGFTTFINKKFGPKSPTLIIEFRHRLFELNYDKKYRIHKYRTHSEIIEDNCRLKEIVVFNECLLMHIERIKMFNQFGENDLHLFERLVQYYGAFFYCHDNGVEVTIHDSTLAYELMFPSVETYGFDKQSYSMTNKIFSIEMFEQQVPRVYHTIDYEIKRPEHLIGFAYHMDGYGIYQDYPANRSDLVGTEQQAIHIKKRFVKKQYKGTSGCYEMQPGKRIKIDNWNSNETHVIVDVKHKFTFNLINKDILYNNKFILHECKDHCYVTNKELIKPLITGIQTATVKATSPVMEIDTNEKGEVFVEFHWLKHIPDLSLNILVGTIVDVIDRLEFFSCWIPVAQIMAGNGCGSYIIPRKGDEVLVYFINGDPDRPIIFGAMHNKKHKEFITDKLDHFKTVLMRSRTFYQLDILDMIPNHSFNEISMSDVPFDERLYLKAHKDLTMHIGHETKDPLSVIKDSDPKLDNNFETHIYGKGHQKHYIQNGGYYLNVENGISEQNVHGSYMINVIPSIKGTDMVIIIEGGQLIITANRGSEQNYEANLLINVTGDCTINTEGVTNINSVGPLNLFSEESINLSAPIITIDGENLIDMNSGQDITIDVVGAMETNVGGDISIKVGGAVEEDVGGDISTKIGGAMELNVGMDIEVSSGGAIEINGGMDISIEAGAAIEANAIGAVEINGGADISISGGMAVEITGGADIAVSAGGAIESTAGADISIMAGAAIEITAGAEINVCAAALVSLEAGIEVNLSSGISMSFESGVDINMASGVSISGEAGIDVNWAAGICASLDAGITADVASGISSTLDSGIETAITAGINLSGDGGMTFEFNAAIFATASTAIEVFVRRPRIL